MAAMGEQQKKAEEAIRQSGGGDMLDKMKEAVRRRGSGFRRSSARVMSGRVRSRWNSRAAPDDPTLAARPPV